MEALDFASIRPLLALLYQRPAQRYCPKCGQAICCNIPALHRHCPPVHHQPRRSKRQTGKRL